MVDVCGVGRFEENQADSSAIHRGFISASAPSALMVDADERWTHPNAVRTTGETGR
jgi:hypothetical protein